MSARPKTAKSFGNNNNNIKDITVETLYLVGEYAWFLAMELCTLGLVIYGVMKALVCKEMPLFFRILATIIIILMGGSIMIGILDIHLPLP